MKMADNIINVSYQVKLNYKQRLATLVPIKSPIFELQLQIPAKVPLPFLPNQFPKTATKVGHPVD